MQIIRHYSDVPQSCRGAAVAIGNFDGVHLGHQALLAHARGIAKRQGVPFGVLVFEPHPQEFFKPGSESFRLTPFRSKARLLAQCGADILFAFPFDAEMAGKSAQDFVQNVLARGVGARAIVVGADFRFGKGRGGDTTFIVDAGEQFGFAVDVFDPVKGQGAEKISSSDIREALRNGQPGEARSLLGHWWTVEGRVEHGAARGQSFGYPTANMRLDGYLKPTFGIYAARATVVENDKTLSSHCGVASLGIRPMFATEAPLLEAYLFDFSGDLYGKHLAVELVAFLRPEMKFETVEELKAQMAKDCGAAAAALDRAGVRC